MRIRHIFPACRSISKALHVCIVLLCGFFSACHKDAVKPSVTVTFLDPEWSQDTSQRSVASEAALREFTRQTGIQVIHLPGPENSRDQLAFTQQLLRRGSGGPDVIAIDMVWPGILQRYLMDLKPAFAGAVASDDPELIATYSIDSKLLAIPYHTNTGILFYRADLLRKYGFPRPPKTWDELEKMALRIQQGERARFEASRKRVNFVNPRRATDALPRAWKFRQSHRSLATELQSGSPPLPGRPARKPQSNPATNLYNYAPAQSQILELHGSTRT